MEFQDKLRHFTKVADSLIASQKKESESSDTTNNSTTTHNLQEREIAGLQYLGYVLHKLYTKHAKGNSKESQQAMAFLKAGKLEDNSDSGQKLIASLNHGGLWTLTQPAQKIFVKLESLFRQL